MACHDVLVHQTPKIVHNEIHVIYANSSISGCENNIVSIHYFAAVRHINLY